MDNQEALGRQGPKAFPFLCLWVSSILAQVSPATPSSRPQTLSLWLRKSKAGPGVGRKEHALPEEPINCPGARQAFYSLVVCLMVYVAVKLNLVNRPSFTGSLVARILQTSAWCQLHN